MHLGVLNGRGNSNYTDLEKGTSTACLRKGVGPLGTSRGGVKMESGTGKGSGPWLYIGIVWRVFIYLFILKYS